MRLTLILGCLALCAIALYFLPENVGEGVTYSTKGDATVAEQANDAPPPPQSSPLPALIRESKPEQTSASSGILECIVVDSAGVPVPKAAIALISEGNQMSEYTANEEGVAVIEIPRQSKGAVLAKMVDSFGKKRVSALTPFHVDNKESLRLTLTQEAASLMGVVFGGESPAADVRVIVKGKSSRAQKTTGNMGVFQFFDLPSNEALSILCLKNGFAYPQDSITITPSEATLVTYDIGSSSLTVHLTSGVHADSLEKTLVSLSPTHSWNNSYDILRASPKNGIASFSPVPAGEYFVAAKIPWSTSMSGNGYCSLSATISIDNSDIEVDLACSGHSQVELFSADILEDNIALEYWFDFPDTSYSRDLYNSDFVMFNDGECQPINAPATRCKLFLNYPAMGILEIPLNLVADEFVSMEVSFPTSNILVSVSDLPEWALDGWLVLQNEKGQFVCSTPLKHFELNSGFQEDGDAESSGTQTEEVELGRVPPGSYRVGLIAGATSSWSEFRTMSADTKWVYWD